MGLRKNFGTNADLELDGVWVNVDANSRVKISRSGGRNQAYTKALEKRTRPYRRQINNHTMDTRLADQILIEVTADHVIRGWETKVDGAWVSGIQLDDGAPLLPYNRDSVINVLTELPELFRAITEAANDFSQFNQDSMQADAGN
jgi:hypothetical protein